MKFKNLTFYIHYIHDFLLVSFVLLCINIACSNLAQFAEMPKEQDIFFM